MSSGRERNGRSWGQRFVLLLNAVMIGVALGAAWLLNVTYEQVAAINRVQLGGTLTVVEAGESGERVLNILLVGYDSSAGLDPDDPINIGRSGEQWGDVTIILHIDEVAGTIAMLSVPRDLWVDVPGYGDKKFNFAYGIEGAPLLIETIKAEFDIPIHHYMSIDFAGFQGIVEAVDHVDVYFDQPARDWNNAAGISQTGFEMLETGCQPLDPPTALAYVRSRFYQVQDEEGVWDYDVPLGDIGRIQRQQDFIYRLIRRSVDAGARNPFTLSNLIEVGLKQIAIDQDLTPQLLLDLGDTYRSFDLEELANYSYPSDLDYVESLSVLLPMREDAEAVLELFRGTPSDDPATVHLVLEVDPSQLDLGDELEAMLSAEGFEIYDRSSTLAQAGIVLQYGGDGLQAAQVVETHLRAAGFSEPITLELVGGDPYFYIENQARSVTMVVGAVPEQFASTSTTSPEPSDTVTETTEPDSSDTTIVQSGAADVEDDPEPLGLVDACG